MDLPGIGTIRNDYEVLLDEGVPLDEMVFLLMMDRAQKLEDSIRAQLEDLNKVKTPPADPFRGLAKRLEDYLNKPPPGNKTIPYELRKDLEAAGMKIPEPAAKQRYLDARRAWEECPDEDFINKYQLEQEMKYWEGLQDKYSPAEMNKILSECKSRMAPEPQKPDESAIQMKMLAINSDMNRRNLLFEFSSNVMKKSQDAKQSIISGIRG